MRGALRDGTLPGGGTALLNLCPGLQGKARRAQDTDEAAAYRIFQAAVGAPARAILRNSGYRPEAILGQIEECQPGYGFDVTRGELRDMRAAGIVDAASVVKTALCKAVHGAALALTIDVLIQRANPPTGIMRS
jgi:chaperonin GroEL